MVIDPAFKADAPARYARLREFGPVHPAEFHLGLKSWVVVGHDLAREALPHPAPLKDATSAAEALAAAGCVLHKPSAGLGAQMMEADPSEHIRLRRLASAAFAPRRTAEPAPRIERIAHDLIAALPPSGEADLVEAFNAPLPATVIAELLGIPEEHHLDFRRWSSQALQVASLEPARRRLVCTGRWPTWSRTSGAVLRTTCSCTLLSRVLELELAARSTRWTGSAPGSSAACCPSRCVTASTHRPPSARQARKCPGPRHRARAGTAPKGSGGQAVRVRSWRDFQPSSADWAMKNTPPPVAYTDSTSSEGPSPAAWML